MWSSAAETRVGENNMLRVDRISMGSRSKIHPKPVTPGHHDAQIMERLWSVCGASASSGFLLNLFFELNVSEELTSEVFSGVVSPSQVRIKSCHDLCKHMQTPSNTSCGFDDTPTWASDSDSPWQVEETPGEGGRYQSPVEPGICLWPPPTFVFPP